MSRLRAKVAISLDAHLLDSVERLRATTGESRSAVLGRALVALMAEDGHEAKVLQYISAYRRVPETQAEAKVARASARKALQSLPWDES